MEKIQQTTINNIEETVVDGFFVRASCRCSEDA
jgi:hypothetical protein